MGTPKLMQPKWPSHFPAGSKHVKHKDPGLVLPKKSELGPVFSDWFLLMIWEAVISTRATRRAWSEEYIDSWMPENPYCDSISIVEPPTPVIKRTKKYKIFLKKEKKTNSLSLSFFFFTMTPRPRLRFAV